MHNLRRTVDNDVPSSALLYRWQYSALLYRKWSRTGSGRTHTHTYTHVLPTKHGSTRFPLFNAHIYTYMCIYIYITHKYVYTPFVALCEAYNNSISTLFALSTTPEANEEDRERICQWNGLDLNVARLPVLSCTRHSFPPPP